MRGSASVASSGSSSARARHSSANREGDMAGTATRRLSDITSARSATSWRSASRTGIGLTPRSSATPRSVTGRPGTNRPVTMASRSSR